MTKKVRMKEEFIIGLVALFFISIAGCLPNKTRRIENVAKDWCLTIRASQVMPVYPLSEDIQPGDIFLVQQPIAEQATAFQEKGFLPLDQLVYRIDKLDYCSFYKGEYWKGTYSSAPHNRPGWEPADVSDDEKKPQAPNVAFPTYGFAVDRSAGFNLAFPIQGIPLGLGLMGADRATGTVSIKKAYTYGIDISYLADRINTWWSSEDSAAKIFKDTARGTMDPVFLRVVSRVFLVTEVDVSLLDARSAGGRVDAGRSRDFKLPQISADNEQDAKAKMAAYNEILNSLSDNLSEGNTVVPGGTVKLAYVGKSSVILDQVFDRPLVIGYQGFDMLVYKDSTLSAPIPSYTVASRMVKPEAFKPIEISGLRSLKYVEKQQRIDQLIDDIDNFSDEKAISLALNPPVSNEEIEKILKLRDPANKRFSNPKAAKEMLKMIVVLGKREERLLEAWEAAVKAAQ